jgi:hypothetical protein
MRAKMIINILAKRPKVCYVILELTVPAMSGFCDRTSSPNSTKQKRSLSDEHKSARRIHVSYLLRDFRFQAMGNQDSSV